MKNAIQLKFLQLMLLILFLLSNISAHKSVWPNMAALTDEQKQYSVMFKILNGSNRIVEFEHLSSVLTVAITNGLNKYDIEKILGLPNKITPTQMCYWLKGDDTKTYVTVYINTCNKKVSSYKINKK